MSEKPNIPGLHFVPTENGKPEAGGGKKKNKKKHRKPKDKRKGHQTNSSDTAVKAAQQKTSQESSDSEHYASAGEGSGETMDKTATAGPVDDAFMDAVESHDGTSTEKAESAITSDMQTDDCDGSDVTSQHDVGGAPAAATTDAVTVPISASVNAESQEKYTEKSEMVADSPVEAENALKQIDKDYATSDMEAEENDGTELPAKSTDPAIADDDATSAMSVEETGSVNQKSNEGHHGTEGQRKSKNKKNKKKKSGSRWDEGASPDKSKRMNVPVGMPAPKGTQQNFPVGMTAPMVKQQNTVEVSSDASGSVARTYGGGEPYKSDSHRDDPHRKIADRMKFYIQNARKNKLAEYEGYVYLRDLAAVMQGPEHELQQIADKFNSEFDTYVDDNRSVNIGLKFSRGGRQWGADEKLSRALSSLLRHRGAKDGFTFLPGGFLYVDDILSRPQFRGNTEEAVQRIVETNDKQRFALQRDDNGKLMIRANQGHSIKALHAEALGLEEVRVNEVPCCVHGTYYEPWQKIRKSGLRPMTRNEIHFAIGEPGDNAVISGMRSTCDVLIFIDIDRAIQDGIKFHRSANNVLLSRGHERTNAISTRYFKEVLDRQTRQSLLSQVVHSPPAKGEHDRRSGYDGRSRHDGRAESDARDRSHSRDGRSHQQWHRHEPPRVNQSRKNSR